jgi:hypothetical protein
MRGVRGKGYSRRAPASSLIILKERPISRWVIQVVVPMIITISPITNTACKRITMDADNFPMMATFPF